MTSAISASDSGPTRPPVVSRTTKPGYATAWWGMATLIATESMVFLVLLGAYFFLRASAPVWPVGGIKPPELKLAVPFSFVLWGSSLPIFYADAAIRRGAQRGLRAGLAASALMGAAFLAFTAKDFHDLTFGWRDNAYGSMYYLIVGLHALHVFIGLAMNVLVQIKAWQNKFTADRHLTVDVFSLYWHFVDVVWLFVFGALFLSEAMR
jgi:heme/copper-type cytochrome/quinol oxidase subunit 3